MSRENSQSTSREKVFISAVSFELGSYRDLIAKDLRINHFDPLEQDGFAYEDKNVEAKLEDLIRQSIAVVCIVGQGFGTPSHRDDLTSFTQLEYQLAIKHNKPPIVLLANNVRYPKKIKERLEAETVGQQESQKEHCKNIRNRHKQYLAFKTKASFQKGSIKVIAYLNGLRENDFTKPAGGIFAFAKTAKGGAILASIFLLQLLILFLITNDDKPVPPPIVRLESDPSEATIYNEKRQLLGTTPKVLVVYDQAKWPVTLELDGYVPKRIDQALSTDHENKITVKLEREKTEDELKKTGGVHISSTPGGANVFSKDGVLIGKTPYKRDTGVPVGNASFQVGKEKYETNLVETEVTEGKIAKIEVVLKESSDLRKGKIQIQSLPEGADVFDKEGEKIGKTPFSLTLESGLQEFKVSLSGYRPEELKLNVLPGSTFEKMVSLKAIFERVKINSTPAGASATFSRETIPRGITPFEVDLPLGKTIYSLSKSGYENQILECVVSEDGENSFFATLQPVTGRLSIKVNPASAKINEGGIFRGTGSFQDIRSAPGKRRFLIEAEGFQSQDLELLVAGDELTEKEITLKKEDRYWVVYKGSSGVSLRIQPDSSAQMLATLIDQKRVKLIKNGEKSGRWIPISISGWMVAKGGLGTMAEKIGTGKEWKVVYSNRDSDEEYLWLRDGKVTTEKSKLCKVWKGAQFTVSEEFTDADGDLWVQCLLRGWVAEKSDIGTILLELAD